jgi:hypothetical protein
MVRTVALATLVASVVIPGVAAHAGNREPACQHLVVGSAAGPEHFGNDAPYPSGADNPDQVDLSWAELRTTRTQLIATIAVKQLSEGTGTLDHGYSFTFRNAETSIQLMAMFGQVSSWARATASVTGEQPSEGGAYAGTALGPITAVRDVRRGRITLTAELARLGVGSEALTSLGAQTWAGLAYGGGGTYGLADHATTDKSYRPGTPDCLS